MNTLIIDGLFVEKDNSKLSYDFFKTLEQIDSLVERKIVLQNGNINQIPNGFKSVTINDFQTKNIIETIIKESKNSTNVIIIKYGNPFIYFDFIQKMVDNHMKYFADYSYSIGYPTNLVPEIVGLQALKNVLQLIKEEDYYEENIIFNCLAKDINSFDIETYISNVDLRLSKLSIGVKDIGEKIFTERLFEFNDMFKSYDDISDFLKTNFNLYYTVPYVCFFQLTNQIDNKPSYFPDYPNESIINLSIEKLKIDLEILKSLNPKMKIVFGGITEPLNHDKILDFIKVVIEYNFELIIETSGIHLNNVILDYIKENSEHITLVFRIDSITEDIYRKIYKSNDLNNKLDKINLSKKMGIKSYFQVVRMVDNESDIEKIVREKKVDDYLIRKYSRYCNRLVERKVVDLCPNDRFGCYSLRRELFINENNQLVLCKYSNEVICNDFSTMNKYEILELMKHEYLNNANNFYKDSCKNCDDFYIFNF